MKEKIYDDQIFPLMAKILEICTANRIAFIADFAIDDKDLHCTSGLVAADCNPMANQLEAWDILAPQPKRFTFSTMVETLPDGSQRITTKRVS